MTTETEAKIRVSNWHGREIPEHLIAGLRDYIDHGLSPGHFLRAVLSNDLGDSFARADDESREAIPVLVFFLYNEAPGPCWGSREKVVAWMAAHDRAVIAAFDGARGEEP